ncbi:hypothetical protein HPP92_006099 [Vanilla planifolia]|uniref:Protein kinase domain-containing protein n=1 Tax=Vanilla planifolia TaxID=51239 RepID=A0A835RV81_VANPL|nr:hypothetical protein HPP92_006099 [Vanilla planifolia]
MSDFVVCDRVSVGHQGRGDEMIFEATVTDSESPLYNSRVVLRELTSVQAKRRGRRALQVLKKLVRQRLMYHAYAMQVHGYVSPSKDGEDDPFILVHGYHGSYSLRHWLQLSDWLPTLEATLALDEEWVRRVGDDTIGGPAVTRQLRLIRIIMRDLLIGVNYLHSHGLAHTQLRLENVHLCPVDRHIKVGILGNAVDLHNSDSKGTDNLDRKAMMIAFDMRCVGFMMSKMVLKELMDSANFTKFMSFLNKMLDRNWGAGWHLLSLLLATKPFARISCLEALRHPFLCGPKWRIDPSIDLVRWGLGSTAVRMAEDYIYSRPQRRRLAYFIELMELLNPHPMLKNWNDFLHGRWRLLYCTGQHIGLTLRQPPQRTLIGNAYLTFTRDEDANETTLQLTSEITFKLMPSSSWPHNKSGPHGSLLINSIVRTTPGRRLYLKEAETSPSKFSFQESVSQLMGSKKWKGVGSLKELPHSLPSTKLVHGELDVKMNLDPSHANVGEAQAVLNEVRIQIPPEMFDITKLVCGTYIDSRMMVLRGVNGSALLFTRS